LIEKPPIGLRIDVGNGRTIDISCFQFLPVPEPEIGHPRCVGDAVSLSPFEHLSEHLILVGEMDRALPSIDGVATIGEQFFYPVRRRVGFRRNSKERPTATLAG